MHLKCLLLLKLLFLAVFFNINYWSFSGFPGSFGKPNLNYSQPVLSNFCLAERRRLHRLKIPCSREPEKEVKVYQKGFSLAAIEHYGQHSIEYWYNSRVNNNIPHIARPTPAWNPNWRRPRGREWRSFFWRRARRCRRSGFRRTRPCAGDARTRWPTGLWPMSKNIRYKQVQT